MKNVNNFTIDLHKAKELFVNEILVTFLLKRKNSKSILEVFVSFSKNTKYSVRFLIKIIK